MADPSPGSSGNVAAAEPGMFPSHCGILSPSVACAFFFLVILIPWFESSRRHQG